MECPAVYGELRKITLMFQTVIDAFVTPAADPFGGVALYAPSQMPLIVRGPTDRTVG